MDNKKFVGRRKCSIALVKLTPGSGNIAVNGKEFSSYVQNNPRLVSIIQSPLLLLGLDRSYDIAVDVYGGGLNGQAEAIKLGIARSLCNLISLEDQSTLRSYGFLTRNSLCKERRKYGLKKARKAPQFSKR